MSEPKKPRGRKPLPPGMKRVKPSITLPPKLIEQAQTVADSEEMTLSDFVLLAIKNQLEREAKAEKSATNITPIRSSMVAEDAPEYRTPVRTDLPYYGTVAAGNPAGALDTEDGTHPVSGEYDPSTHFVVRVNGESMLPDFADESFVVCRRLKSGEYPSKGNDVVACDASGAYLKRLAYVKEGKKGDAPRKAVPRLTSINPEYDDVVPVVDCPIVAVVVGKA